MKPWELERLTYRQLREACSYAQKAIDEAAKANQQ